LIPYLVHRLFFSLIYPLVLLSFIFAQHNQIEITSLDDISYISLNSLIQELNIKSKSFDDNNKIILYHKKNRVVLSGGSSFFLINDEIFHLYTHVKYDNDDFFVPAKSFITHLTNQRIFDNIHLDSSEQILVINKPEYNILSYDLLHKGNGFSISLKTSELFDETLIATWVTDNNWLSINIPNGLVDSLAMDEIQLKDPLVEIKTIQMDKSVQISFLLNLIPDEFDIITTKNHVIISVFTAQKHNAQKIKNEKQKYMIDTIILDAGHGGKDPGACVKNCEVQEKNITLALVKNIGKKLEKSGYNVIYTRIDDRFVTLKNRTKIANTNNGDIFLSIHVNSISNSPTTKGFETYLLRVGKTDEAIKEVEKRENSVIEKFEQSEEYLQLSQINATIIQDANMKQSATLAEIIQQELSLSLNQNLNRGVKQAGFQVLWGVTMPNVLIEVGFITNKEERKNLLSKKYQNKISEGIVNAISVYKKKYETHLFE